VRDVVTRLKGGLPPDYRWLDSDVLRYSWDSSLVEVQLRGWKVWLVTNSVRSGFDLEQNQQRLCAPLSEINQSLKVKGYYSPFAG